MYICNIFIHLDVYVHYGWHHGNCKLCGAKMFLWLADNSRHVATPESYSFAWFSILFYQNLHFRVSPSVDIDKAWQSHISLIYPKIGVAEPISSAAHLGLKWLSTPVSDTAKEMTSKSAGQEPKGVAHQTDNDDEESSKENITKKIKKWGAS